MRYAQTRRAGFTLIELMIAVAVVAILAAIAYPSYRRSVMKSRRSDAKVALSQTAQQLERCYSQFGSYDSTSCPVATTNSTNPAIVSPEGYYQVNVTTTATTYQLVATPTSKGAQYEDTACAKFTLDQTGSRSATAQGGSNATATCW